MPKTFCALAFPRLKRLEIVPGKNGERGNLSLCAFFTSPSSSLLRFQRSLRLWHTQTVSVVKKKGKELEKKKRSVMFPSSLALAE